MLKKITILVFYLLIRFISFAQQGERYNTFYYNVNEGLLQSHINNLAFDKYNFGWLSFVNGLQKFDGVHFTNIPVQNGLPDDKNINFFFTQDSVLLLASRAGISRYDAETNKFRLLINLEKEQFTPLFLGEYKGVITCLTSNNKLLEIKKNNLVTEIKSPFSFPVKNNFLNEAVYVLNKFLNLTAIYINNTLQVYDLQQKKIIASKKLPFQALSFDLKFLSAQSVVFFNSNINKTQIQEWDFFSDELNLLYSIPTKPEILDRSSFLKSKNSANIFTIKNRVYSTNSYRPNFVANELVTTNNNPLAGNNVCQKIIEDHFGNLYLLTVDNGLIVAYQNEFNIKYYGIPGERQSFASALCIDKENNKVLLGCNGNGILIYDSLQHLIKHIKTLPGSNTAFTPASILKLEKNKYLLFCFLENDGWILENDRITQKVPISGFQFPNTSINYYGNKMSNTAKEAWVQTTSSYFHILKDPLSIKHFIMPTNLAGSCIYQNEIVFPADDTIHFYNLSHPKQTSILLPNTGGVRCIKTDGQLIYIGSNKGLFILDKNKKIVQHINKEDGLKDECIYAILLDNLGNIWCSTNQGIFCVSKGKIITQIGKVNGLQENEFNTNVAEISKDGELFFGGVNGLSSFYPFTNNKQEENIKLIFTDIKINNQPFSNDSLSPWVIEKLDLKHNQNSLAFEFIAMGKSNPTQNSYFYKMVGADSSWSQNTGFQPVRYYLQPGKYTLKISASKFTGTEPQTLKEIQIIIHPPIWKSWWFISLISLLALLIIYYTINKRNKNQYGKILQKLEQEKLLATEREKISQDLHDSIGAYANVVMFKTELLEREQNAKHKNSLMVDLKFASKEIMTSLRENIWALKKQTYTPSDCVLRINNFVQTLSRHYPKINFRNDGEAPQNVILHYSIALHIVRIIQEAITNALKHARPKNIFITHAHEGSSWTITVIDDGIGFEPENIEETSTGNGLTNMKQRAAQSNFQLTLKSEKNKGTTLTLGIPLKPSSF